MKKESVTAFVHRLVTNSAQRDNVFQVIAQKEKEGYSYENALASLELLVLREVHGKKLPFAVKSYHVSMRGGEGNGDVCDGIVKVVIGGALFHEVAEGEGPISALDRSLRMALAKKFQHIDRVQLKHYSVELVGTLASVDSTTCVRIITTNGKDQWDTIGVSKNVVKASLYALVDAFEYALLPVK